MKRFWIILWLLPFWLKAGSVSYSTDTSDFANPERGFFVSNYYWGPGNGSNESLSSGNLANDASNAAAGEPNITLVRRLYVLSAYTGGALPTQVLTDIATDCSNARSMGIKLIPRFSYNQNGQNGSGSADAPESVILNHISNQIFPILSANEDVIAYLEAGFIGQWGEWHDSTNGLTDGSNANSTTGMKDILLAELAALPTDRMIAVRYPGYSMQIFGSTSPVALANAYNGSNYSRLGVHDDCFENDQYDAGTYQKAYALGLSVAQFKAYMASQVYSISVGGESCGASGFSGCANSTADLSSLHWSAINAQFDQGVINGWGSGGCLSSIKTGLGYRYRLIQSSVPASATVGGSLPISFQVTNDGYASCYNPRNMELILRPTGGSGFGTAIPVLESQASFSDPRFWDSGGQTYTVSLNLTVPGGVAAGTYDVLLNLPDGKASLYNKPAYSIRLANTGVWESGTGYNKLNQSVTIISCPACTATPTPSITNTPVPGSGNVISIDFVGGSAANGTPASMGAAETAGLDGAPDWNNASGSSGAIGNLMDNTGGNSGASLNFSAGNGSWSTSITEAAGNARMMKGYIDASNSGSTSVQITGLSSVFTANGYSVYVYFDGDNGTGVRTGDYTIGSTMIAGTDAANTNFSGGFSQASSGSNGNYVLFTGQSAGSFTLSAVAGASSDAFPRAPINGIQIVANAPSGSPTPSATATRTPSRTATPSLTVTTSGSATRTGSPSATPTPSLSLTPSASRSATPSPTSSPTVTVTLTPTPSFSASATNSPGPLASPTYSRTTTKTSTPTASQSATPTLSPSLTRSLTASPTLTVTPSFSASATNSPGPSASPTYSRTVTKTSTPTASQSATPTLSPSLTRSLTASLTLTITPSLSASETNSPGPSPTPTYSRTITKTPTATLSVSSTPSMTSSPTCSSTLTLTPSQTPSFTASQTITAGPSPTSTESPSPTPTASPSQTSSPSPTATMSATPSFTGTISASPSGTASLSASPTAAQTATAQPSKIPTSTPVSTASPTPQASASRTPAEPSGPCDVLALFPVPNPNPVQIAFDLGGPADSLQLKLYSKAMVCIREFSEPGQWHGGWNQMALPADWSQGLANGHYYMVLRARNGQGEGKPKIASLMWLR